ncbi:MAG: hypothetical protein KatS3mg055_2615 [Chloroflexus sp.]|uniref:hypothetical protein n=1 Tax=Chloroflexus sp. TaxID=1904827 RepID=UPI0021DCBB31|nr:hypothetical protein [Chloroflexus sp.]GIV90097.1 MAG: hypothetical protein KatS3mg055_2615 [Chloroflexus sp.]
MKRALLGSLAGAVLALILLWHQPIPVRAAQTSVVPTVGETSYGRGGGWRGMWVSVGQLIQALSTLTGVDKATIQAELQNGRSLAQIAAANGSSGDALVQAVVDTAKSRLDQAVSNGRLTQTQADQMLATIRDRATALVNDTTLGTQLGAYAAKASQRSTLGWLIQATADQTGLDVATIRTRLRNGETLRAIITGAGADPQKVIDAAVDAFRQAATAAMQE